MPQLTLSCGTLFFMASLEIPPEDCPIPVFWQGDTSSGWPFYVLPQNLDSGCSYIASLFTFVLFNSRHTGYYQSDPASWFCFPAGTTANLSLSGFLWVEGTHVLWMVLVSPLSSLHLAYGDPGLSSMCGESKYLSPEQVGWSIPLSLISSVSSWDSSFQQLFLFNE